MPNHGKRTSPSRKRKTDPKKDPKDRNKRSLITWIGIGLFLLYFIQINSKLPDQTTKLTYKQFITDVEQGKIRKAVMAGNTVTVEYHGQDRQAKVFVIESPQLIALLTKHVDNFNIEPPKTMLMTIFLNFAPILLFIAFLWFVFYRQMSMGGGGKVLSFGKSRAKLLGDDEKTATFMDVAGIDEAKEELVEIVDFLKDPKKFQRLGGRIPKGVLLIGPPGTGKTLLARAIAGEANVSFFTIAGSDFVEMFVGIGASRVRDTFAQARKSVKVTGKGCILFIDEIDAVGRSRGAGWGGGHDEREQTLNALLVEMDGFDAFSGVILVAATNRPDVLDPALLRPGRFDRTIVIDRPDIKGREGILKVHTKNIILDKEVDLRVVARQTSGFSGADLANIVNEAALLAARRDKKSVTQIELETALERVMGGLERRSRVISEKEKRIVAVHESGHALLSVVLPHADPPHKVSIIPRGVAALGYTMNIPLEDKYLKSLNEFMDTIAVLLGGRVSEMLTFGEPTTGAQNDLERATEIAHRMVCEYGMSDLMGALSYGKEDGPVFLARDFVKENPHSQLTLGNIDIEVKRIIDECYQNASDVLVKYKTQLSKLSEALLEREVLMEKDVRDIIYGKEIVPGKVSEKEQKSPNQPDAQESNKNS